MEQQWIKACGPEIRDSFYCVIDSISYPGDGCSCSCRFANRCDGSSSIAQPLDRDAAGKSGRHRARLRRVPSPRDGGG
jgi:hypothetical protein